MSKQNSLDKYFVKRKEVDNNDASTKKQCIESEIIITESNIIANQSNYSIIDNISTSDNQAFNNNLPSS